MFNRRIKINFVSNFLYQMSLLLFPLITSPYLTRVLGAECLGRYQYANTIASYFCFFCVLGIATYGNRECAIVRDDRKTLTSVFWGIYGIQITMSTIVVFVYLGYLGLSNREDFQMGLLQVPFLLSYALDITWLYYGLEYFYRISLRNFLIKIISVFLIFILVKKPEDVYIYCLIMTGTAFLSQAVLWPFTFRFIDWKRICWQDMKTHIRPILLLFLPVIGIGIYSGIDKIMIGDMINKSTLAVYSYAEYLSKLPVGIVTALTTVMLPRMSKIAAAHKSEEGKSMVRNTMQVTMFLALPVAAGIAGIADKMVPWFYAEEFSSCIPLIKMLVIIIILIAWTYVVQNQCLIPMHMDSILVKSALLTALLNVSANLILIPVWGVYGAAFGTIISEMLVMFFKTYHCRKYVPIQQMIEDNVYFLLAALVMYGCVYWAGRQMEACPETTLVQIGIGIIVYMGICFPVFYRKVKRKK